MTSREAREILSLHRPGLPDADDPQMREALDLVRTDPELAQWFEKHQAFQAGLRQKLRQIEVPADLKASILAAASPKVIRPPVWRQTPAWLAAAAVFVVLVGLAALLFRPPTRDRFADFQQRMVGTVLRQYSMDLETSDMEKLKQFVASRGGPTDFEITPGLEKLPLAGGGFLRWRNHPVSMVCFDRGDKELLYLFVMKRSALKDPPPETPLPGKVNELATVSWSSEDKVYVLAGPEEPGFDQKYR